MISEFTAAYRQFIHKIFIQDDLSWPQGMPEGFESDFIRQTRNDGIQLLIHEKASQSHSWREWPQSVRADFSAAAQNDAIVDTLRQQDFAQLHHHLAKEDIYPVLLKGAALSLTHYPSSYLRPRGDTDFLIPPGTFPKLQSLLPKLGYRSEVPTGREYGNYQLSFSKKNAAGINAIYDVHWKLCNPELFAAMLSYEEIEKAASRVSLFGETVRAISPTHALLHACIHLVAHHPNEQKLIWLYDIHLLAHRQNQEWFENFHKLTAEKKVRQVCGHELKLANDYFQTKIPGDILQKLTHCPEKEASARFLLMTPSLFHLFLTNFAALPFSGKLRLLAQNLFPSSNFVMEKYKVRHKILLPFWYVWRIAAGLPKIFMPVRRKA